MANIFQDKLSTIQEFAQKSAIDAVTVDRLSSAEQLVKFTLPLKKDDGTLQLITGYRCRYNTLLGPAKGGIRYHQDADEHTVNVLALGMVLKNSLVGLPYGGGKGEVIIDPATLSEGELERLSRLYMRAVAPFVGPMLDIPAPDVNTNPTIMGWMLDEYENYVGHKAPAVITGKPIASGGSQFRVEATGFGVYLMAKLLMEKLGRSVAGTTVAIQGFGNLGMTLARFLHAAGFKVVAVSDSGGAIYAPNGIDIDQLVSNFTAHTRRGISVSHEDVSSFANPQYISNAALLELGVDILVPAALDGVLTEHNADKIKAKYIIEGANSPTSKAANAIIEKKGIILLPDILCNAGGVIVSYFEWVQNLQCFYWSVDEVKEKLTTMMVNTFNNVWDVSVQHKKPPIEAAYHVALHRLQNAMKAKYNLK